LASGLTLYLAGWFYLLLPHLQIVKISNQISFSIKSIIMANIWWCTALVVLIFTVATNNSWALILDRTQSITLIFGIGFALQTALAALAYLMPSILGGGPAKMRLLNEVSAQWENFRWLLLNLGVILLILNWQGAVFMAGVAAVVLSLIVNIAAFSMLVRRGIKQ
jgi:nitrite reductase (NO-forming)